MGVIRRLFQPDSTLILLALAAAAGGCDQLFHGLTAPGRPPSETWRKTVPAWSPFLVVQPDAAALEGYRDALTRLTANGAVQGVRIGLYADGRSEPTVALAASFGLDVIGIVDNEDLFRPDLEAAFDEYRRAYPTVRTFQIGNEVTTWRQPMSASDYLAALARIYAHVVAAYPDVTLVSQSTFGAGSIGAMDLQVLVPGFAANGMSPRKLVVAMNVYTDTALMAYAAVLPTLPGGYRYWVTETGIPDPNGQVNYVARTYPRLVALLGAERIYWYALWAGDAGGDSAYSLIRNPAQPPIAPGELFQKLTSPS
jgi:hypothetical protein